MSRDATSDGKMVKMGGMIGVFGLAGRQKLFLPQSLTPKMEDFSCYPRYNRPGGGVGVSGKLAMGHS